MNIEKLQKDYKWLFYKVELAWDGKRHRKVKKEVQPIIEDHGSHWRVFKVKDSSPLILSKDYARD